MWFGTKPSTCCVLSLNVAIFNILFQIKELTESMMENQNLLDKTTRDKMSLTAELESIKENVIANEYGKVRDIICVSLTY